MLYAGTDAMERERANADSLTLYHRASRVMTAGVTRINLYETPHPRYASRGLGCRVWDVDGTARIDLLGNYFSLVHGHAFEPIVEFAVDQLRRGACFGMPTAAEVELAEAICGRVASVEEVRFMNSGSEAIITALKAARAFTDRPRIAKIEGAYHGLYDYAEVSLGPSPAEWGAELPNSVPYSKGVPKGVLDDVVVIPFNDTAGTLRALRPHADRLAAVLIDLLPSRAGMVPIEPDYLAAIADFCRSAGSLLIVDEVISLRLASGGLQSRFNVAPDLTVMGKVIGGGFPVGAVGGRRDVMAVFDPRGGKPRLPHGGTFTANPLAMGAGAIALAHLDAAAIDRLNALGDRLRRGLRDQMARTGIAGQVAGMGSLFRIHLLSHPVVDYRTAYQDRQAAQRIERLYKLLFAEGFILSPNCSGAVSTPMTADDVDALIRAFGRVLMEAIA